MDSKITLTWLKKHLIIWAQNPRRCKALTYPKSEKSLLRGLERRLCLELILT